MESGLSDHNLKKVDLEKGEKEGGEKERLRKETIPRLSDNNHGEGDRMAWLVGLSPEKEKG